MGGSSASGPGASAAEDADVSILLVGLNHRTAPVQVREQLAFGRDAVGTALMLFRNRYPQAEALILSTCNRVEMLVASDAEKPTAGDVVSFIAQARDLPVQSFRGHLYQLSGEAAIRHVLRVAAGLDSMVVGEYQIVSQLKAAYAAASEQGSTGRVLNRLIHHAFAASKRVRSETEIGQRKVSVPSVAVEVAKQVFSDFSDKRCLVVGAGEMAQLVCEHLREAKLRQFVVASRSVLNAKALAEACGGVAVHYDQLDVELARADVVITATACPKPFLSAQRVAAAQKHRQGRPLLLIDLAVPRNVEAEAGQLAQVYVYDVDELGRIAAENRKHRVGQIEACERILDQELEAFGQWLSEAKAGPMILQMFQDARDLRDMELQRLFNQNPELEPYRQQITALAERLMGKLLHPCVSTVKRGAASEHASLLASFFHALSLKHRK